MQKVFIWFLRLFAAYRSMEERVRDLTAAMTEAAVSRGRLQDEAVYWREKAEELDRRLVQAHEREVESREMVADFVSQQRYGFGIFHRAPQLPADDPAVHPIPPLRVQARRLQREKNLEVLRQMAREE